jgi:hypothetical protein
VGRIVRGSYVGANVVQRWFARCRGPYSWLQGQGYQRVDKMFYLYQSTVSIQRNANNLKCEVNPERFEVVSVTSKFFSPTNAHFIKHIKC